MKEQRRIYHVNLTDSLGRIRVEYDVVLPDDEVLAQYDLKPTPDYKDQMVRYLIDANVQPIDGTLKISGDPCYCNNESQLQRATYAHIWYEGYDGLSAIVNRIPLWDPKLANHTEDLVLHPDITILDVEMTDPSEFGGDWFVVRSNGNALPLIINDATKEIQELADPKYRLIKDEDKRTVTNSCVTVTRLDEASLKSSIVFTLAIDGLTLSDNFSVCTTAKYFLEEDRETHEILNKYRVRCLPTATNAVRLSKMKMDNNQNNQ